MCVCVCVCLSVCVFGFEWKQETKTRRDTFSRHSLWTTKIMSILTHRNFLMDPALGLSFFKSQNFRQRGDSGSNFFLKSFILTSRFQRGVCQAPIVCRFGVERVHKYQPLFWPIVAFAPYLKKPLIWNWQKLWLIPLANLSTEHRSWNFRNPHFKPTNKHKYITILLLDKKIIKK